MRPRTAVISCSKRVDGLGVAVLGPHVDPELVPAGEGCGAEVAGDGQHQVATFNVLDDVLPLFGPIGWMPLLK